MKDIENVKLEEPHHLNLPSIIVTLITFCTIICYYLFAKVDYSNTLNVLIYTILGFIMCGFLLFQLSNSTYTYQKMIIPIENLKITEFENAFIFADKENFILMTVSKDKFDKTKKGLCFKIGFNLKKEKTTVAFDCFV